MLVWDFKAPGVLGKNRVMKRLEDELQESRPLAALLLLSSIGRAVPGT